MIDKTFLLNCSIISLLSLNSWCADVQTLNDQVRLSTPISCIDLSRITVQGDRIQQVFNSGQTLAIETDVESGQLFVKPLSPDARTPIMLTIITEGGLTQDLKLIPQKMEAATLILKSTGQKLSQSGLSNTGPSNYKEQLLQIIRSFIIEGTFDGHKVLPGFYSAQSPIALKSLTLQATRYVQMPEYVLQEYRLHNPSAQACDVNLADFVQSQAVAVACGAETLKPGQSTALIIMTKRSPGLIKPQDTGVRS